MSETRGLSILEYNRRLDRWERIGRNLINQRNDWSTGVISNSVYISDDMYEELKELTDDKS